MRTDRETEDARTVAAEMHVYAYTTGVITVMASPISASRELRVAVGSSPVVTSLKLVENLIAAKAPPVSYTHLTLPTTPYV